MILGIGNRPSPFKHSFLRMARPPKKCGSIPRSSHPVATSNGPVRLNNRESESGLLGRYMFHARIEDPIGGAAYRYGWKFDGPGLQRLSGGGPNDNFIEFYVNAYGPFQCHLTVQDGRGNTGTDSFRSGIRFHDR